MKLKKRNSIEIPLFEAVGEKDGEHLPADLVSHLLRTTDLDPTLDVNQHSGIQATLQNCVKAIHVCDRCIWYTS